MTDSDTKLSNSFSLGGYWWLPDKPDQKIYGTLRYQPEAAPELTLEGSFQKFTHDASDYLSNVVIHGMTPNGIGCTLVDAYQKSNRMHMPGITTSEFFCNRIFVGKEFIMPDMDTFESAIVEFSDLTSWLLRNPFNRKISEKEGDDRVWGITYTAPKLISQSVKSIQASIKFESSITSTGENQSRILSHTDHVRFRPNTKQNLDWYLNAIFNFRILLSFLIGEPIDLVSIKLCTKKRMNRKLGEKYYRYYVDLCIPHYKSKKTRNLYPPDILIPYPLIKNKFEQYLNNWYKKADEIKTTCQLLFGVLVQKSIPVDFQFLALIQAFESYHRYKNDGKYLQNSSYEPIKKVILNAIPKNVTSDHRAALKSRIKYGNEYSLRKRFNLILNSIPDSFCQKIIINDMNFVNKIISTRNYLTHRDESDKKNVMNSREMLKASDSLKVLLMVLMLNELGIDLSTLENAISANWRFKRMLQTI